MKKQMLVSILMAAMLLLPRLAQAKTDAKTTEAVMAAMNTFNAAYTARNIDAMLAVVSPDVFLYGTGGDEKRSGKAELRMQAERDWAQTEAATFVWTWTDVNSSGNIAWTAMDATINITAGGEQMSLPGRLTCVLRKQGDAWLIEQMHASFPAAAQEEGQSWPEEKKE